MLRDEAKDRTIPETSIIIEYLAQHYPGKTQLFPADRDLCRQMRLRDRFYDLYVHVPMQKIVADRLRPAGKNDPYGVEEARDLLKTSLGMIEQDMAGNRWAMGDDFTMADCAAAPALFYADMVQPFRETHKKDGGLSRPADGTAVLCPRSQGSRAVFRHGSEIAPDLNTHKPRRRAWPSDR